MSILEDLVAYVDANFVEFTAAVNLFVARLPDTPDFAAAFFDAGGNASHTLGGGRAIFTTDRVQLIVRATSYDVARSWVEKIRGLLDIAPAGPLVIGGTRVMRILADESPTTVRPDDSDRERLTCTMTVWKEMDTL